MTGSAADGTDSSTVDGVNVPVRPFVDSSILEYHVATIALDDLQRRYDELSGRSAELRRYL
jgi:hypothetical protein